MREGALIEPGPGFVDVGEVGCDEVVFLVLQVLEEVRFLEIDSGLVVFGVLSGDFEGGLADVGGGDLGVSELKSERDGNAARAGAEVQNL